jgi:hypothetical protein
MSSQPHLCPQRDEDPTRLPGTLSELEPRAAFRGHGVAAMTQSNDDEPPSDLAAPRPIIATPEAGKAARRSLKRTAPEHGAV